MNSVFTLRADLRLVVIRIRLCGPLTVRSCHLILRGKQVASQQPVFIVVCLSKVIARHTGRATCSRTKRVI